MSGSIDILEASDRTINQPASSEDAVEKDRRTVDQDETPKPAAESKQITEDDIMMPLMAFLPEPPEGFEDDDFDEAD
jgi:hypothetical protein